jgi:hypothetical protein
MRRYNRAVRLGNAKLVLLEAQSNGLQTSASIVNASKQRQLPVDTTKPLLQDVNKTHKLNYHDGAHEMNHESDDDVNVLLPSPTPEFVTVPSKQQTYKRHEFQHDESTHFLMDVVRRIRH